jgi:hypothetical protein
MTDTPAIPLRLSQTQRRLVAGFLPHLEPKLLLDEPNPRILQFTEETAREIATAFRHAVAQGDINKVYKSLRCVLRVTEQALNQYGGGRIDQYPVAPRLFQLRISLKGIEPEIWRRIQVKNCTLDRLHVHIQLAMGWQNCHLYQFKIDGVIHGDPELLCEGFEDDPEVIDSYETKLSDVVPRDGRRYRFVYEYDFGDCWEHEILFEGYLRAEKGTRYPVCLEGQRACPPEDVGGKHGYAEYLEALADPEHKEHESWLEWRGKFDPEKFDAEAVTKRMRRGRGNWPSYSEEEI